MERGLWLRMAFPPGVREGALAKGFDSLSSHSLLSGFSEMSSLPAVNFSLDSGILPEVQQCGAPPGAPLLCKDFKKKTACEM